MCFQFLVTITAPLQLPLAALEGSKQRRSVGKRHRSLISAGDPLVAPDWMLAVCSPMRFVCARRRATGLVGVWRSIARLLNQVTGAGQAAVVI